MSRTTDIVFLDCETLGLDRMAPIWEFAAVRVTEDGRELAREEFQIQHWPAAVWLDSMPESFLRDYRDRYQEWSAISRLEAAQRVQAITEGKPEVAGSNASFDLERLEILVRREYAGEPNWYHHPLDIPSEVRGYLRGIGVKVWPPYRSDAVSLALGVDPAEFLRHSAMGDVEWCLAQWRIIEGLR